MDKTDGNVNYNTSDTSVTKVTYTGQTIVCPYKDRCTRYPDSCSSCKRNSAKKDYYIPDPRDWYIPYNPWYDQPIIWYTSCITNNTNDKDCHIYDDC